MPEFIVWRPLIESKSNILRIILAESLGTFVLVFVGIGGALQCSKYSKQESCSSVHGPLAGGLGAALGIYIGANASGGHANPAVTIAFAVLGRLGSGFRTGFKSANVPIEVSIIKFEVKSKLHFVLDLFHFTSYRRCCCIRFRKGQDFSKFLLEFKT